MAYQRILVGTDLSEAALDAARLAGRLRSPRASVRVVFVASRGNRLAEQAGVERSREEAVRGIAAWTASAGLADAETAVLDGHVARELAREAAAMRADLVVVAGRGTSHAERVLLGSTARGVLRAATVDTLVARRGDALRHVLVATDLEPPSRVAAERALAIAKAHDARLTVAHAIDPGAWYSAVPGPASAAPQERETLDALAAFDRDHLGGSATRVLLHGRPSAELPRYAKEARVDLLVLGTHGGGALERMLLGTTAEAVAERAPCSVLVARG